MAGPNVFTRVAMGVFTTSADPAQPTVVRQYGCTTTRGAALGRYLVTLTDGIGSADCIPTVTMSSIGDVGTGAALLADVNRISDTVWEIVVYLAFATKSDAATDRVRFAIDKFDAN